jgi:hypothetical protein
MMQEATEKAYSPKEMSVTLDIGDSTLRKWCLALEKNGYKFFRNEQDKRIFVEADLVILRHFQNLVKQHNMQLDNAAMLVVDRFGKGAFEVSTDIVLAEKEEEQRDLMRSNEVIEKLMSHIEKQEQFNRELIDRLDKQEKYIEESLNHRDELLLNSIKEARETRQLIAAAQEEKKAGFFARLLGK